MVVVVRRRQNCPASFSYLSPKVRKHGDSSSINIARTLKGSEEYQAFNSSCQTILQEKPPCSSKTSFNAYITASQALSNYIETTDGLNGHLSTCKHLNTKNCPTFGSLSSTIGSLILAGERAERCKAKSRRHGEEWRAVVKGIEGAEKRMKAVCGWDSSSYKVLNRARLLPLIARAYKHCSNAALDEHASALIAIIQHFTDPANLPIDREHPAGTKPDGSRWACCRGCLVDRIGYHAEAMIGIYKKRYGRNGWSGSQKDGDYSERAGRLVKAYEGWRKFVKAWNDEL